MLFVGTTSGLHCFEQSNGRWDHAGSALDGVSVNALATDRDSAGTIIAAARKEGVYCSTDGGRTWALLLQGVDATSVVMGPDSIMFAGVQPAAVYRSESGGEEWQEMDAVRALPTSPLWNFPLPPHMALVRSLVLSPTDSSILYGGIEVGGVIISKDAGASWAESRVGLHVDIHSIAAASKGPGDFLYAATGKGVYRSLNGGADWEAACSGLQALYTVPVAVHPQVPNVVFTAASDGRPRYWRTRPDGAKARIYRSTDCGGHWEQAMGGLTETLPGAVDALMVGPDDADTVYAGTADGRVLASEDAGQSWTTVGQGLPPVHALGAA